MTATTDYDLSRTGEIDAETGGWVDACPLAVLVPDRGVAVLVEGAQVALFRVPALDGYGDGLYAVDNRDPASGANVVARGLIGSVGTTLYVASPMYKHRFDLRTGRCLDDDTLAVAVWPVRVSAGRVQILAAARPR